MEFVLVRKIYADVHMVNVHPGLIDKKAFVNASPNDLKVDGKPDNLTILQKDFFHLVYRYSIDEHTDITVNKELIEVGKE